MNTTIALILAQDGLSNGIIYALLSLSILMVFLVTRVLWVPAGEFVAFGALTLAVLQKGEVPGTAWLLAAMGGAMALSETVRCARARDWRGWPKLMALAVGAPAAAIAAVWFLAPLKLAMVWQIVLALLLLVPMGPILYRVAFRPLANSSVLTLLFVAIAVHYALIGLALVFFGPEQYRTEPFVPGRFDAGFTRVSWHLMLVLGVGAAMLIALWLFFERTLWGKALRAVAVNRVGARLVGIRTEAAGLLTFTIAALIGSFSGFLIAPMAPLGYDSGFLIALKGFVGAVVGGLVSFPLAVVGAIVVGLFESYASFFASAFKEAIVFALLVPILLWRSAVDDHHHEEEDEE
jgi:branched-subunit amino acid ABC-type transport system permease component